MLRHLADGNVCNHCTRLQIADVIRTARTRTRTTAETCRPLPRNREHPLQHPALGDHHDPLHKQHRHPSPTATTPQDARFHPAGSITSMLHYYYNRHHHNSSVDLDVHACAVCASVFGRILTTYYSRRRRRRRQWNGTRFDDNDRHRCHHCCSGPVVTRQSVGRRRMVVCVSFFAVHAHHTVRAFVSIETTNYFPPLFCTLTTR